MEDRKTQLMTYVRQEQYKALSELSKRTGVPMARMIRDAIDKYLKERKDT